VVAYLGASIYWCSYTTRAGPQFDLDGWASSIEGRPVTHRSLTSPPRRQVLRRGLVAWAWACGSVRLEFRARLQPQRPGQWTIKMLTRSTRDDRQETAEGTLLRLLQGTSECEGVGRLHRLDTRNAKITTALASGLIRVICLGVGWWNVRRKNVLPSAAAGQRGHALTSTYTATSSSPGSTRGSSTHCPSRSTPVRHLPHGHVRVRPVSASRRPVSTRFGVRIQLTQRSGGSSPAPAGHFDPGHAPDVRNDSVRVRRHHSSAPTTASRRSTTPRGGRSAVADRPVRKDKVIDPGFSTSKATSLPSSTPGPPMTIGHNTGEHHVDPPTPR